MENGDISRDCDFRFAEASDAPNVASLVNSTYHGTESAYGWTPETHLHSGPRTSVEAVAAHILDPNSRFILCERPDALIGCALIERCDSDVHFGMFAVRPRLQAAGIGKAILAKTERCAIELWQSRTMTMSVISVQGALIAYYERRGYYRTGDRAPFPFGEEPGALRTDYDLVTLRKNLT